MAGTFKFELVSPEKILISGDATEVIVPGMEGQFTVFPGHSPVISTLKPGVLEITLVSGKRRVFVRGGFAEVQPESLTILARHLVDLDGSERGLLEAELKYAETLLSEATDDAERFVANAAVGELRTLTSGRAA